MYCKYMDGWYDSMITLCPGIVKGGGVWKFFHRGGPLAQGERSPARGEGPWHGGRARGTGGWPAARGGASVAVYGNSFTGEDPWNTGGPAVPVVVIISINKQLIVIITTTGTAGPQCGTARPHCGPAVPVV